MSNNIIPFPISPKAARVDALCEAVEQRKPHEIIQHYAKDGGVCLIVADVELWFPAEVFEDLVNELMETGLDAYSQKLGGE